MNVQLCYECETTMVIKNKVERLSQPCQMPESEEIWLKASLDNVLYKMKENK